MGKWPGNVRNIHYVFDAINHHGSPTSGAACANRATLTTVIWLIQYNPLRSSIARLICSECDRQS